MADKQRHTAEKDAGLNLDLDFIDYPTGWAIQRRGLDRHWDQCSAAQTGGAMLCDCTSLIYSWAELKWKHERDKAFREAAERALHELDDLDEQSAAGLYMAVRHGGDTDKGDDWNEAFRVSRLSPHRTDTSVIPPGKDRR